jgi:transposase InsO family protein
MKRDVAVSALNMTVAFRAPPKECIHRTGRGCQYCSNDCQRTLRKQDFKMSMSGTGNSYEDRALEAVFITIKAAQIRRDTRHTRRRAEMPVFEYIKGFYNPRCRHSTLGWKGPVSCERKVA